jgi:broad specificity phosphatase PhoE
VSDVDTKSKPVALWLVRHGQTDWNVEGRYQGQADPPLNRIGLAEAEQAARKLAGEPLRAIYSSDLLRARQTAALIAQASGAPLRLEPRLREVNLGAWEGMLFDQIRANYPRELREREQNPLNSRPPGGETVEEVWQRARAVVSEISRRHAGEQVALVSHGLTLGTLLAYVIERDPAQAFRYIPDNGLVRCIEWPA